MNKSEIFLNSFNRIEKWLRRQLDFPSNMGVSEMIRRIKKKADFPIHEVEFDLIEFSKLRNAIVHNKIEPDFIIAEPNQWAVDRIIEIENKLLHPKIIEEYTKANVKTFEAGIPLRQILYIIVEKGYTQFPIYEKGKFRGLLTTRGLGMWFAKNAENGIKDLDSYSGLDILDIDSKRDAVYFLSPKDYEYKAINLFKENPRLEAILITKDGKRNSKLLGIIGPKDFFGELKKR